MGQTLRGLTVSDYPTLFQPTRTDTDMPRLNKLNTTDCPSPVLPCPAAPTRLPGPCLGSSARPSHPIPALPCPALPCPADPTRQAQPCPAATSHYQSDLPSQPDPPSQAMPPLACTTRRARPVRTNPYHSDSPFLAMPRRAIAMRRGLPRLTRPCQAKPSRNRLSQPTQAHANRYRQNPPVRAAHAPVLTPSTERALSTRLIPTPTRLASPGLHSSAQHDSPDRIISARAQPDGPVHANPTRLD